MTRILLDTHVFLWSQNDSQKLGTATRQLIVNASIVYVSAVSAIEVAIKVAAGRMKLAFSFSQLVAFAGYAPLDITYDHARQMESFSFRDHKDPFDRLLVAQALVDDLLLVTADRKLSQYKANIFNAER